MQMIIQPLESSALNICLAHHKKLSELAIVGRTPEHPLLPS